MTLAIASPVAAALPQAPSAEPVRLGGWRGLLQRVLSGGTPPSADQTRARFLFLNYEIPLGYAALATATFAALKARRPDAYLAVAASGVTADVLRGNPHIDELIVTPHAIKSTRAAAGFFLKHIRPRRGEFDYVATDGANLRARVAFMSMLSGVRWRIGLTLRPELYHAGMLFDRDFSNIANNLRALDVVNLSGPTAEPEVHFTEADLDRMQALLAEAGPPDGPRIALVTQVSGGHPNQWFDDRWAELCARLTRGLNAQLVFLGAPRDQPAIEALQAGLDVTSLSTAGRTDIPQLAALLTQCDLVLTLDTGTLHVARAVAAPTVVIGHAATPKHTWLPLGDPLYRILLHDDVPCALCRKFTCHTRECMQENTVDRVDAAVLAQLKRYPPSAEARAARAAARLIRPAAPAGR